MQTTVANIAQSAMMPFQQHSIPESFGDSDGPGVIG
jgi:hypothetical protein